MLPRPFAPFCVLAAVTAVIDGAHGSPEALADGTLHLHMMPDQGLRGRGAVCLDGSDAGFWFLPASDPAHANDWQVYFQGGGWCYDPMDCWGRSNNILGSSNHWQKTMNGDGILSSDCEVNPDFCAFNRVMIAYCDGNSFAGDRDAPLEVTGLDGKVKPLFFRGKRIIDAVLETLMTMGLDKAKNFLLTGCSAGGLATFLHTDYVHQSLLKAGVPLQKFKSVPISGFFLFHSTIHGEPVYPRQMKEIFELSNATGGVNARCAAAMKGADVWKCNFAQYAYAYTLAPIFPLNSAYDSWQDKCIYTSVLAQGFPDHQNSTHNGECNAVPAWTRCTNSVEGCSEEQMLFVNKYQSDFVAIMQAAPTYKKAGNGAFIHSCHTHCEAQSAKFWVNVEIAGVTMRQAVSKWWNNDGAEPAAEHSYSTCLYNDDSMPRQCNPTCGNSDKPQPAEEIIFF